MWNIPSKEQLALLPRLYETENIPLEEKIIHIRFFLGGCDWYIAEYDGDDIFWGYVILNDDYLYAEWGYSSLAELMAIKTNELEIDRDIYWQPRKASEIERIMRKR